MNIQIMGIPKSSATRKAIRFFKERRVPAHFRDVSQKGFSRGELQNIARSVDANDLIDQTSALYKKRGLEYMEFDPIEELLEAPLLATMPIVRNGALAAVGDCPEVWLSWMKSDTGR